MCIIRLLWLSYLSVNYSCIHLASMSLSITHIHLTQISLSCMYFFILQIINCRFASINVIIYSTHNVKWELGPVQWSHGWVSLNVQASAIIPFRPCSVWYDSLVENRNDQITTVGSGLVNSNRRVVYID